VLCRCGTPSRVYKTSRDEKGVVHRHRVCPKCGKEFHTEERRA
jgi:ribosomal protein S27AE